jgi:hypothetical protein
MITSNDYETIQTMQIHMSEENRDRAAEFYLDGICLVRAAFGGKVRKIPFSVGISGVRSPARDISRSQKTHYESRQLPQVSPLRNRRAPST